MTPSKYVELLYTRQKHWESVAAHYGSSYPKDDVQEAYIKAFEYVKKNGVREDVDPFGLMFFCVRSMALSIDSKVFFNSDFSVSDGSIEIAQGESYDKQNDDKIIEIIHKEVASWGWFERTLFTVYFDLSRNNNDKMSMRRLATETKIALPTIFHTIKECKTKIKNRIDEQQGLR